DLAARVSTGAYWPDEGCAPSGSVLVLSAEDAADDTVVPRLEASGANLDRMHILKAVVDKDGPTTFSLQADLTRLGEILEQIGDVALIIVDPITAFLGKIDSHRTSEVRDALAPLAAFAEKFHVAVLCVSHPPKAVQTKAINAVTGSLAFVAAA